MPVSSGSGRKAISARSIGWKGRPERDSEGLQDKTKETNK
jgi:hypothetical protein